MVQTQAKPTIAFRDELEGKPAIITGSTSGIGLGIARAFAASGMPIMLNGLGDPAEIEAWKGRDPITRLERQLRDQGHLDDAGLRSMEGDVTRVLEAAVTFAEASPFPLPEQATDDVFAA